MGQLANVVLTDRASTPVNHTFVPRDIDSNGVGTVVESTGTPIGDNRFSVGLRRTADGRIKTTVKGVFPIVQTQTINGITSPVVVRTAYANFEFSYAAESTLQERKDVVGMMASSLAAAQTVVNDTIVNLNGVY